jgi:hypothetical protein
MAGPRLLDTEITTKTHNRTEQGRSPALPGKARRTAPEPPCVGMPARLPAAAVVCGGGGGGITVYPGRWAGDRWRAVWYEGGVRRQCEAVSEERLAAKLERAPRGWPRTHRTWNGPGLS